MQEVYFHLEDSESLIGMKYNWTTKCLYLQTLRLLLVFQVGGIIQVQRNERRIGRLFPTVLENFSDTALAPKAAAQLKSMGVVVANLRKKRILESEFSSWLKLCECKKGGVCWKAPPFPCKEQSESFKNMIFHNDCIYEINNNLNNSIPSFKTIDIFKISLRLKYNSLIEVNFGAFIGKKLI